MNYLTKPKLYNPGFLYNDENSRIKQGLMPQDMSSNCYNGMSMKKEKKLLKNPYYNNPMFPIRSIYVNYENPQIPNDSYCLLNIRAP